MIFIARPHLCRFPRGAHFRRDFLILLALTLPLPPPLIGAPPLADRLPATILARDIGKIGMM